MKAALIFASKLLVLVVALIIIFMIAINVSRLAQTPASTGMTSAEQAQQAAALLGPLVVYTFLISLVFAWIIRNSRWRGLKLIGALVFTFFGLMTVITQIETIAYLRTKMPPGLIKHLFVMGAVVAVLFIPVAVLIMGKIRGSEEPQPEAPAPTMQTIAARFAFLAVVYVVLYYLFGYYVAWQNPEVRVYYVGNTELKGFLEQMRSTWSGTPWMLPFQIGRGLFWALLAYPVVKMLKKTRFETAGIISALFAVWSFVLLMPNPLMPASVARSHFWETLWCDMLLGAIVGWVLASPAKQGRTPALAASAGR